MPRIRLRTQILLLQVVIIIVSLAAGFGIVLHRVDADTRTEYGHRAEAIAETVASDTDVRAGAAAQSAARRAGHPATRQELAGGPLQRQALAITERTGVLFVVIADDAGYRIAHPDSAQLGAPLSTDPSTALGGEIEVTQQRGTLGDSVRAKAPVLGNDGTVVGLVSVGISTETVAEAARRTLLLLAGLAALALVVGILGSGLLARRWRRLTLGLEPEEMAELIREQNAVLYSGSEGVIAIDAQGVARVINDRARELLGVTAAAGTPLAGLGLTDRVAGVVATPTEVPVAAAVNERVVLVASRRVHRGDTDLGTVLTAVDRTDVEALTRELDSVQAMSAALRAQRHESANRVHVVAGLLRDGRTDEALAYLDEIAGRAGVLPVSGLDRLDEPHLRAFVSAKAARARERGVVLRVGADTALVGVLTHPVDTTTLVGNLLDNAIDAAGDGPEPREVELDVLRDGDDLAVIVVDSGPGFAVDDPFVEGVSTRTDPTVPGGRGLGLVIARQVARGHGGDVTVVARGGDGEPTTVMATLPEGCVTMPDELRILVVDDDFRVAAMHAKIVDAMVGLTTAGSARTLSEARAILDRDRVDLALVDVYLPDGSGIDLVREMRCDAFILGAADDAASVRAGLAAGALQYLIKPFPTTELARRLGAYTAYRRILGTGEVTQEQVDAAASVLRSERPAPRRDEGGSVTERRIVEALRAADGPMLADDIAAEVGVSPATARRYLAELVRAGTLTMALQYGATGRPRQRYTLS